MKDLEAVQEKKFRKTVLVASTTKTAQDVRIVRHINFLADYFDVVSVGYGESPSNVVRHIRIPDGIQYLPISLGSFLPHVFGLYGVSSRRVPAVQFLKQAIENIDFDVVLLNDVQTLPIVEHLSRPVVVDMHEYAPLEMEDDWRFRVLLKRYYTWLCIRYLPLASAVTTVSRGLALEYEKTFGVHCEVVLNARDFRTLEVQQVKSLPIKLVHSGLAAKARQLEVMIKAVANIDEFILDLYLVSAPRQAKTLKKLKKLALLSKNVRVLDPVDSRTLPEVLNNYDLSLAYIAPANFSLEHCMPNKLFDSIQARIGVISGPSPDLAEFCLENKIGLATKKFDANELLELLRSLDANQINSLKQAADECANRVTAETEALKILELLQKLIR